jgi:hypothetical protein
MFDSLSDFYSVLDYFSFAIAAAALLFARKALNQAKALRARLDRIEGSPIEASAMAPAAATPAPPPLPVPEAPIAPSEAGEADIETTEQTAPRVEPTPHPRPVPVSRNASAPAGWSGSAD